jgi:hypothetical protein
MYSGAVMGAPEMQATGLETGACGIHILAA